MAMIFYREIPTLHQFQKDSSVTFAIRSHDPVLKNLDVLLERYHSKDGMDSDRRYIIVCDLFLTANYWIKSFNEKNPLMKKERYQAVMALFSATIEYLADVLGCHRKARNSHGTLQESAWYAREVKQKLVEIFGKQLEAGMDRFDVSNHVRYYSEADLKLHRLWFKGGRVYKYNSARSNGQKYQPVESRDCYSEVIRRGAGSTILNWAPFVMTFQREFYMSRHDAQTYHSAYTHGRRIACAGTMLIEGGLIRGLRGDSGHYKPLEKHVESALRALLMFGVDLSRIMVLEWEEEKFPFPVSGTNYLLGKRAEVPPKAPDAPVSQPAVFDQGLPMQHAYGIVTRDSRGAVSQSHMEAAYHGKYNS